MSDKNMYKNIFNPEKNMYVSINSIIGKKTLEKYLNYSSFQRGGAATISAANASATRITTAYRQALEDDSHTEKAKEVLRGHLPWGDFHKKYVERLEKLYVENNAVEPSQQKQIIDYVEKKHMESLANLETEVLAAAALTEGQGDQRTTSAFGKFIVPAERLTERQGGSHSGQAGAAERPTDRLHDAIEDHKKTLADINTAMGECNARSQDAMRQMDRAAIKKVNAEKVVLRGAKAEVQTKITNLEKLIRDDGGQRPPPVSAAEEAKKRKFWQAQGQVALGLGEGTKPERFMAKTAMTEQQFAALKKQAMIDLGSSVDAKAGAYKSQAEVDEIVYGHIMRLHRSDSNTDFAKCTMGCGLEQAERSLIKFYSTNSGAAAPDEQHFVCHGCLGLWIGNRERGDVDQLAFRGEPSRLISRYRLGAGEGNYVEIDLNLDEITTDREATGANVAAIEAGKAGLTKKIRDGQLKAAAAAAMREGTEAGKLEAEVLAAARAARTEDEAVIDDAENRVISEVLTLKKPCCKQALAGDWKDCTAVRCQGEDLYGNVIPGAGCGASFCGWCLDYWLGQSGKTQSPYNNGGTGGALSGGQDQAFSDLHDHISDQCPFAKVGNGAKAGAATDVRTVGYFADDGSPEGRAKHELHARIAKNKINAIVGQLHLPHKIEVFKKISVHCSGSGTPPWQRRLKILIDKEIPVEVDAVKEQVLMQEAIITAMHDPRNVTLVANADVVMPEVAKLIQDAFNFEPLLKHLTLVDIAINAVDIYRTVGDPDARTLMLLQRLEPFLPSEDSDDSDGLDGAFDVPVDSGAVHQMGAPPAHGFGFPPAHGFGLPPAHGFGHGVAPTLWEDGTEVVGDADNYLQIYPNRCSSCGSEDDNIFSSNQWHTKGQDKRCHNCVDDNEWGYECDVCGHMFPYLAQDSTTKCGYCERDGLEAPDDEW